MTTYRSLPPLSITRDLAGRRCLTLWAGIRAQVPLRLTAYNLTIIALILTLGIWAMTRGDYPLTPTQVVQAIFGEGTKLGIYFVTEVRAPRIIAALLVGAALGLSGSIFQTISGNALGSPDIIGFTYGAATGALINIIAFNAGPTGIAVGAVTGGLATSLLVYLLTRHTGLQGFRLVLIGIGVGSTLSAINSLLVVRASLTQAQTAASWLAGSLNTMNWTKTGSLALALLILLPLLLAMARPLTSLRFGDAVSAGLGVRVSSLRIGSLFIGVLLVSLATATTGPLAFVALAAPHIAKTITRASGTALGSSALTGALLVLSSDLIGQYALPTTLQVGVVTGALGGIYLIYLIATERKN
ncbi:iron chelate uptake ABC transporter family permease subunit [Rothia sp. SD9660Na]|uniref:FecCD family ABC transporter permease n=1 Tax=Rothia sp. SD9660Na TaxID=3047030 RepID=UPI0024BBE506|nr:iron chelate uptake ABC transporter family permease subunit [Rothia sp. SD9660Na]WHS50950.1 iron chelate uptake ABC transporter family permease subunit [Rothia sp. SD9660Na]